MNFNKWWAKFKWYVISGIVLMTILFLVVFNLQGDFAKDLNKWMYNEKKKIVSKQIDRVKSDEDEINTEIKEIEDKIDKIDKKIEENDSEIDKMDLKELSDAWKALGY